MSDRPSAIELINEHVLKQVHLLNPNQLKEIAVPPYPAITLLLEFDNGDRKLKKLTKQAEKVLEKYATDVQIATEPELQQQFWKLRQATSSLIGHNDGLVRAVPLTDAAVPPDRLREYIEGIYSLLEASKLQLALWGHAGDANLHMQPRLNLGQVGDRQKAFRFLHDYYKLVISLGGTVSAEAGDGRMHTPYLENMYGPELYSLLHKVKQIFDPYNILNPGVKFGTSLDDIKEMVRGDYSLEHLYDHLPRS